MTKWNEIDNRLRELGKDRVWLAEVTSYSWDTIRQALAPKGKARSARMLTILSRAIEDEEERQRGEAQVEGIHEVRPGVYEIFRDDAERHRSDLASRIVGAASLADYCHDVVVRHTDAVLARERAATDPDPDGIVPSQPGTSSPGDPDPATATDSASEVA